jgi:hypothetical protein
MIAVIFEVFPADGRKDDYLEHAARLRGGLSLSSGFRASRTPPSCCRFLSGGTRRRSPGGALAIVTAPRS